MRSQCGQRHVTITSVILSNERLKNVFYNCVFCLMINSVECDELLQDQVDEQLIDTSTSGDTELNSKESGINPNWPSIRTADMWNSK